MLERRALHSKRIVIRDVPRASAAVRIDAELRVLPEDASRDESRVQRARRAHRRELEVMRSLSAHVGRKESFGGMPRQKSNTTSQKLITHGYRKDPSDSRKDTHDHKGSRKASRKSTHAFRLRRHASQWQRKARRRSPAGSEKDRNAHQGTIPKKSVRVSEVPLPLQSGRGTLPEGAVTRQNEIVTFPERARTLQKEIVPLLDGTRRLPERTVKLSERNLRLSERAFRVQKWRRAPP